MYREAINNYNEALVIFREQGQKHAVASTLIHIANLYNELGDYIKARPFLKEAEEISIEMNTLDFRGLVYQSYAQNFYLTKNYKQAYDYQVKYKEVMDTIFNKENSQQLSDIKTQFEVEKKEAELKTIAKIEKEKILIKTQEDKKRQNIIIMGVLGVLLLVSIFSVFIFRGLQENKKANKIITAQKNEVEHQKHLVDEKQKEILDSIKYAKRIQTALLANDKLLSDNLPEHFVLFKPKDIVAGDFYWATKLNGSFVYVTGDCTGHGVPGAFMSLLNISKLNETINQKHITRPDLILNDVKKDIIHSLNPEGSSEESKDGMDAIVCQLDFNKMKLHYAAANNSFFIVRNNELLSCKADKMPVGKSHNDNDSFTYNEIDLQKGDMIYTCTDGFGDQFGGPKGKKFKLRQLKEIIVKISQLAIHEQKNMLNKCFEDWRGELEQVDDVLVIGVRV
jgi:serine phosphatase RsbU (regulator of sigma subunit)